MPLTAPSIPFPRRLTINGNMDHFQRVAGSGTQTSTTTYSNDTSYAADRMFVLPAGASVTQKRSTTVPDNNSQYSLEVDGAASVTTVDIGQRIRSSVVLSRGKRLQIFSCYVRNETGSAFSPDLRIGTPGAVDDFTTVTNRLATTLQSCADSAWTRVWGVFDPSAYTNIANGMEVVLRVPTGVLVAAKIARIAQFDLRPGNMLLPYIPDDDEEELRRCEYYYQIIASGGTIFPFGVGDMASTTTVDIVLHHRRMRVAPVLSVSAATDFQLLAGGAASVACTAVATTAGTTKGVDKQLVRGTTITVYTIGVAAKLVSATANAVIKLNAEM